MVPSVSGLFDFLERQESIGIIRHEVSLNDFTVLRGSLRKIIIRFREFDDPDGMSISDQLRMLLSQWLTVPIPFDDSIPRSIREVLGTQESLQGRWGSEFGSQYKTAIQAAERLPQHGNRAREVLKGVIQELFGTGESMAFYCHRNSRKSFESVLEETGNDVETESLFIHTLGEYRKSETFDTLIKFGPLRARGWGAAPDSLITAPHYKNLIQIVWAGCSDEPGFGYEPIGSRTTTLEEVQTGGPQTFGNSAGKIIWNSKKICHTDSSGFVEKEYTEEDDLQLLNTVNDSREKHAAMLLMFDEEYGMLRPPNSQTLSFDPEDRGSQSIGMRVTAESLREGMFLIVPVECDADMGGVQAEKGEYSSLWKSKLIEELRRDREGLIQNLRAKGINLINLDGAVRNWCRQPSTVVHAPQQINHFRVLLEVLGIDQKCPDDPNVNRPFWRYAWNEVRRSRGEAIQAGVHEQELIEEQLIMVLKKVLSRVRENAAKKRAFDLPIPPEYGMTGWLRFLPLIGIEGGLSAPASEMKLVCPLNSADQWRE